MQTVSAKCVMESWDSSTSLSYKPGQGPLPGGLYEIDRDGQLASLKTPRGNYIFEFDRNANPTDKTHNYDCKVPDCGAKFKALSELGSHMRSQHKDANTVFVDASGEDDGEEELDLSDRTCDICQKVLKTPNGLRLHKEKAHKDAVTATA